MHLVSCYIALAGDTQQILVRGPYDTVSWPEVGVLQTIHGEDAVTNIKVEGEDLDATRTSEKLRLVGIYGAQVVENVYPGRAPMIEMEMPGYVPPRAPATTAGKHDIAVETPEPAPTPKSTAKRSTTVIPPISEPAPAASKIEPIPEAAAYSDADD